ncbi:NBR1-Ig-like domain-containing protein [Actinoplanes sp. NPDC049316]|uniref:NBR1-Ig-like domain-containing protein n=1 Tax=Actinoplanes sp. NPDC049316 TaxID=3154727 RepID=UPI0034340444
MEDQRAAAGSIQDGMAAERFAEQLRTLRTAVGNPSFRRMAGLSGRISHTTLHEAAAGTRFPSWETTREFVRACDADETEWRRRWEDAQPGENDLKVTKAPAAKEQPAEDPPEDEVAGPRRHRLPWLAAAAVAVVVTMAAALGFALRGRSDADGSAGAASVPPSSPAFSDSMIPGDASKFVADVTIPDGTRVKVDSHFVKVWALANVGTVAWHNRFLERMNPTGDEEGCRVPDRVAIGDTPPGEQVMISVPVTAPKRPGKCWVSWKMVDEHGQAFFPSRRPVYFMVTVTA